MLLLRSGGSDAEPIPASIADALRETLTEQGVPTELSAKITAETLGEWHRSTLVVCECTTEPRPRACVHRLPSGEKILRWYQGVHRKGCPFERPLARQRKALVDSEQEQTGAISFLLARASGNRPGKSAGIRSTHANVAAGARPCRLGDLLARVLHRCGLDHIHTLDLTPTGPSLLRDPARFSKRLYRILNETVVGNVGVRDTSVMSLTLMRPWLDVFLPRVAEDLRPQRPQGFLITSVRSLHSDGNVTIAVDTSAREYVLPVRVRGIDELGPNWLILHAAETAGRMSIIDGYARPAFTEELPLPLTSPSERELLAALIDQMRFWYRWPKTRAAVRLIKPVLPLQQGDGHPCPAAVIVRGSGAEPRRSVAVQYSNSADPIPLPSQAPTVTRIIPASPRDLDDTVWRSRLTAALFKSDDAPQKLGG